MAPSINVLSFAEAGTLANKLYVWWDFLKSHFWHQFSFNFNFFKKSQLQEKLKEIRWLFHDTKLPLCGLLNSAILMLLKCIRTETQGIGEILLNGFLWALSWLPSKYLSQKTQTTRCRNNYPTGSISMTREIKWVENQFDKYQVDFMKA